MEPLLIFIFIVVLVFADRFEGWAAGLERFFAPREEDKNRKAILTSIRNLNRKLDELDKHPDDWQTAGLFVAAWPEWMRRYEIDGVTESEVLQAADAVRRRMLLFAKRYESVPLEARKSFVAKTGKFSFNVERWEVNESKR